MVLGQMKKAGDLPAGFRAEDIGDARGGESRDRARARRSRRDVDQPAGRSVAAADCGDPPAIDAAIDFYVEAPDDFGGTVRHYEIAELVRVAAPIYVKFGVRNAPACIRAACISSRTVIALSRERVRRAAHRPGAPPTLCAGSGRVAAGGSGVIRPYLFESCGDSSSQISSLRC